MLMPIPSNEKVIPGSKTQMTSPYNWCKGNSSVEQHKIRMAQILCKETLIVLSTSPSP